MLEVWILTFYLGGPLPLDAGEYQSKARCEQGARIQLPHWRLIYGRNIAWRCDPKGGTA